MPMNKQPEFFVLYCDSVRAEIGGMHSLIGVLQDVVRVSEAPKTIPRLSVFFNLHLFDTEFDHVIVELLRTGVDEPLATVTLSDVDNLRTRISELDENAASDGVKVTGTIESTPFIIDHPMTLQLRARLSNSRALLSSSTLKFEVGS